MIDRVGWSGLFEQEVGYESGFRSQRHADTATAQLRHRRERLVEASLQRTEHDGRALEDHEGDDRPTSQALSIHRHRPRDLEVDGPIRDGRDHRSRASTRLETKRR
jgi:hypothetical protein